MYPNIDIVSRILFPTPESSYTIDDFPDELIWVPKSMDPDDATPQDCVPCLFLLSPSARFFMLYLHSNAEDLGHCYHFCTVLRNQFQVHVLAVEYPGYGVCPGGQADEQSVTENAFTAFRFIREVLCWPLDSILLLGRSIGTGPALSIAVKHQVYGVILVSPFLSVQELSKTVVGPLAYLIQDRFPNKDRVPFLRSPLLVVHGKKDITVPVSHGELLYRVCKSRKRLVCPADMEHNTNLHTDVSYFVLPMLQFFALPDYSFDELKVPEWVFDKRLSIHHPSPSGCPSGSALISPRTKRPSTSPTGVLTPTDTVLTPRDKAAVPPTAETTIPTPRGVSPDAGPWEVVKRMEMKHKLEIEQDVSDGVHRSRGLGLPGDRGPETPDSEPSLDSFEAAERRDPRSGLSAVRAAQAVEEGSELPVPAWEGQVVKVPGTHTCQPSSPRHRKTSELTPRIRHADRQELPVPPVEGAFVKVPDTTNSRPGTDRVSLGDGPSSRESLLLGFFFRGV